MAAAKLRSVSAGQHFSFLNRRDAENTEYSGFGTRAVVCCGILRRQNTKKLLQFATELIASRFPRSYNQRSASSFTLGEHTVINMFTF
jgi:hypothetical protein